MLSRLVITFLPRSKRLLISWLQSPLAVILESKIIKSVTVSTVFHEVMGPGAMILVPQAGIELASPALQDEFLTTGPPGKSQFILPEQEL